MILSYEQLQKRKKRKNSRYLNVGSQTNAFSCTSDIVIFVGDRGVGKTHLILTKALPKISEPKYKVAYLRREIKDATGTGGIADASKSIFSQFGTYLESVQSLLWKFHSGARATFLNYSAPMKEFAEAIQGKEYTDACIDEITHIDEEKFNAVFSNLRNTYGGDTQIFGTCNADPTSWIKNLIQWWLDPDTGLHLPERDGVTRYFFQYGNSILESYWGDSPEEVYELAKVEIDAIWKPEMEKYGGKKTDFALSLTVYEGKMYENEHLMKSGGTKYMAKLQKGSIEMKNRYARACWKLVDTGDCPITTTLLERLFRNSEQRTGVKYASMDVAGEGKDKVVLWIWDGYHIENVYMERGLDAKKLKEWVLRILAREGVSESNFIYDAIGVGFALSGHFENAKKFVSNAKVTEDAMIKTAENQLVKMYSNLKAQAVGKFIDILKNHNGTGECGFSINPELLNKSFFGETLKNHLLLERRGIIWKTEKDGVLEVINKKDVIKIIGRSPDIFLSMIYRVGLGLGYTERRPMSNKKKYKLSNFLRK